jgi:hypothetical protein
MIRYRADYLIAASFVAICILNDGASSAAEPKTKINFDQHIAPILREKCLACHNADKAKGGLDLSTFAQTMEGGASGKVVKPGDPDGSRLFTLTAHKEMPYMPPQSPMIAKESVDLLQSWIQQGALENAGSKAMAVKPKTDVSLSSIKRGRPDGPPPMPEGKPKLESVVTTPKANAVVALAASPWAPLVAVGGQKQVLLYHGDSGELLGTLPFQFGLPQVLKFSRNGSLLLVGGGRGGQSGKVVVFNVRTGEQIIEVGNELDSVLAADISADQSIIALGGPGKMIRLYSTKDGTLIREIKKHTDWIYAIEFSPDGVLLATADRSGGLLVWEANTGREFYNLRGHTSAILDLSWRDDSNVLASASEDTTIKLWEMENGNIIKNWGAHGGGTQSVKFSHDNRLVSTGRDRVTKMWDQNGTAQKTFPPHNDVALRVAFSHDNNKVYSGDWTGIVNAFTVTDAKQVAVMQTNPPNLQAQLDAATKLVAAKEAEYNQVKAAHDPALVKVQQTGAEMAPALRLANDSAALAKTLADQAAPQKAIVDKAQQTLTAAQQSQQAKDVKAKALQEAHAKIQAAADANKANAELQAAAAMAKQQFDAANGELAAAVKLVTDSQAAFNKANEAYAGIARNLAEAQAAAKLAADILAPRKQASDAATAAYTPLKANFDKVTAELTTARAELEKLKAAAATPPKK